MVVYIYDNHVALKKCNNAVAVTDSSGSEKLIPIAFIEAVVIFGNASLSGMVTRMLVDNSVNIMYCSRDGKLNAFVNSFNVGCTSLRTSQYSLYFSMEKRLELAREICAEKIKCQIGFLKSRRNIEPVYALFLKKQLSLLSFAHTLNELRGLEGICAKKYFEAIATISTFEKRSRRPAEDSFNALLNLTYAMILSHVNSALAARGFDVCLGFLHDVKNGRPSLSLDVLEIFRCDADRFVLNAFGRKEFSASDFTSGDNGYRLTEVGFKKYIKKYHRALDLTEK